ncbi:MAG: tetratricopeptide repeat protein [Bacillota bacterium]|nr:tetratricopeptide repeat protein [Bacillota bacterium]
MNKSTKLYKKAMDSYYKGNIDIAIEQCEQSISENNSNGSSINLKGLLYYFKGELDNAQTLWKMNYKVNNDEISAKYYESSKNDLEKLQLYVKARKLINALRIDDALNLLYICKESDFNSIQVNNSMAECFIKKGAYEKAIECINKVLELDKKNDTALKNKKTLANFGLTQKRNYKNTPKITAAIFLVLIFSLILVFVYNSRASLFMKFQKNTADKTLSEKKSNKALITKHQTAISPSSKVLPTITVSDSKAVLPTVTISETKDTESFPSADVKKSIEAKDYDKLYEYVDKWQNKTLAIDDKSVLNAALDNLKSDGVQYYYKKGSTLAINKDYKNAMDSLFKAYKYGIESYLYPHILYFLGFTEQNLNEIELSMNYFEEYDSKYPSGNYEEAVLYQLALMNKDINTDKSKKYANKLKVNYPKSIYNNDKIKQILTM